MRATLILLLSILMAACATAGNGHSSWVGKSPGTLKAKLTYFAGTPPQNGWLAVSGAANASGRLSFTKWGAAGYRHHKTSFFTVEPKWQAGSQYLGLIKESPSGIEFCTANPELGGDVQGDTVYSYTYYDYCTLLVRR